MGTNSPPLFNSPYRFCPDVPLVAPSQSPLPPYHHDVFDPFRGRSHLPVLREVEDSSEDERFGEDSLLDESDLSALAEASMKLEELEQTVGRILSQVEREQELHDDVHSSACYVQKWPESSRTEFLLGLERATECFDVGRDEEIDRYSRELDDQLSDLETCARAYEDGAHALGRLSDGVENLHKFVYTDSSEDDSSEDRFGSHSDILAGDYELDDGHNHYKDEYYLSESRQPISYSYEYESTDLHSLANQYEQDLALEYCAGIPCDAINYICAHENMLRLNTNECNTMDYAPSETTFNEESYSERLRKILQDSDSYSSRTTSNDFGPQYNEQWSETPLSWASGQQMTNMTRPFRSELYEATTRGPQSCSLEDLEECINKLVLDVEREEARLRRQVKDRLHARSARFSMPMPPRPLSEVPAETMQGRASSMDSLLQPHHTHDIWWEGVYRNITRTPDGQETSHSDHSSECDVSNPDILLGCAETDTREFGDSQLQGQIMLLVRTSETGKDTLEIRSMRHVDLYEPDTNNNSSESSQGFMQSFVTSITPMHENNNASTSPIAPPGLPLQRLFVHSPPNVRELRSYSCEDLCRPQAHFTNNSPQCSNTLPGRNRRQRVSSSVQDAEPFPLEFTPPPALVQYVIPNPSEVPLSPSPAPCPIEYVTPPFPCPAPGRGYCTWLPHPSPRGWQYSSDTQPSRSSASERKGISSSEVGHNVQHDVGGTEQSQTEIEAFEEPFTKAENVSPHAQQRVKTKEEKKKEKKDREREEKEKKKREKKDREIKEKEEKDRKDKEKKERKEREKREKEAKDKRGKEEKKQRNEKEKADREKMEKDKGLETSLDVLKQHTEKALPTDHQDNDAGCFKEVEDKFTKQSREKTLIPTTITTITLPAQNSSEISSPVTDAELPPKTVDDDSEMYSVEIDDNVPDKMNIQRKMLPNTEFVHLDQMFTGSSQKNEDLESSTDTPKCPAPNVSPKTTSDTILSPDCIVTSAEVDQIDKPVLENEIGFSATNASFDSRLVTDPVIQTSLLNNEQLESNSKEIPLKRVDEYAETSNEYNYDRLGLGDNLTFSQREESMSRTVEETTSEPLVKKDISPSLELNNHTLPNDETSASKPKSNISPKELGVMESDGIVVENLIDYQNADKQRNNIYGMGHSISNEKLSIDLLEMDTGCLGVQHPHVQIPIQPETIQSQGLEALDATVHVLSTQDNERTNSNYTANESEGKERLNDACLKTQLPKSSVLHPLKEETIQQRPIVTSENNTKQGRVLNEFQVPRSNSSEVNMKEKRDTQAHNIMVEDIDSREKLHVRESPSVTMQSDSSVEKTVSQYPLNTPASLDTGNSTSERTERTALKKSFDPCSFIQPDSVEHATVCDLVDSQPSAGVQEESEQQQELCREVLKESSTQETPIITKQKTPYVGESSQPFIVQSDLLERRVSQSPEKCSVLNKTSGSDILNDKERNTVLVEEGGSELLGGGARLGSHMTVLESGKSDLKDAISTTSSEMDHSSKVYYDRTVPNPLLVVEQQKTIFVAQNPAEVEATIVTHIMTAKDSEFNVRDQLQQNKDVPQAENILVNLEPDILDDDFLLNTPKVSIMKTEATSRSSTPGAAPVPPASQEVIAGSTTSSVPYVTTPNMQRRAHSQRRSQEERPMPVDVTYLQSDSDTDDEQYIVTEPGDDLGAGEDRFRINSSPEILHTPVLGPEDKRSSPDDHRVKFQVGSLDSQDSLSSDATTQQTISTKSRKFTVEKVQEEIGIPQTTVSMIEGIVLGTSDEPLPLEREDRNEKKLRRVERHFERMASQSLVGHTPPEEREEDFQRVVSQLSQEEVAGSEDEYENLLIQATTPSEEWDSRGDTDDSPEDRTAQSARQFADGLGVGRDGSLVQPHSTHPLPTPRNLQLTSDKDKDDDPDSEPAVQETIKSYSERRAFWEHVSSGSGETPTETPILSFPQTTPVPIPRHLSHSDTVDSETAYIAKVGLTSGVENDAFSAEDADPYMRRKPKKTQSVEEHFVTPPPVAVRKALFERSISLPANDFSENGRRKKQFEDQLKKEMVAENLLQQLDEEAIPEHKELPHRTASEDLADSVISDDTFETDVDSSRSSVKDIAHAFEKGWSTESSKTERLMRETASTIVKETLQTAESIVHKAEELTIAEPEEEVEEWRVQDIKSRFEAAAESKMSEDEKSCTEIRRESLAKTHEVTSSRLAEVMQYKSESVSKPSDSLEVHVDKSETEDTEKSRDLDEDIKELENSRLLESGTTSAESKGTRAPGDHQSQSSSEDTQCESDVTPEDHPYPQDCHSLYQPQQHIQDIVWEVGVQEQTEPLEEEYVQDILVPGRKSILQNGDLDEHTKHKLVNGIACSAPITEEEARKVAEELVHDIEKEVSKRHIEIPISDTVRQLAYEKNLEEREIQLMESLLAKKSRDHSHLFSRTDTTTSSMEITDEDLRSSGVEIDLSPTESQSGLYSCMDARARQEDEKPEALRSDIDLSDLKPDPLPVEESSAERIRKNFSVIEESDECDTRSEISDPKTDPFSFLRKTVTESHVDPVKEQNTVEKYDGLEKNYDIPSDPNGSPTGSTSSSGKKTPPPKPGRKSKENVTAVQRDQPEELIIDFLLSPTERQNRQNERMEEKLTVRTESMDSQKSSSQDEKSPMSGGEAGRIDASESASVVRRHNAKTDVESSSSGEKSGNAFLSDRRSGADFDPYSSSSDSHYHSFEQSYSRPCSSDVEGLLAVTTGSSEYESAIASTRSVTSTEYQTAVSSLSSRESMKSLDSESSGHLASVEVSSEASETLVPSATELEHDDMDESSFNIIVEDELERRMLEQYDNVSHCTDSRNVPSEDLSMSKFSNEDVSEDDREENKGYIETDEEDPVPPVMKRSHEMTFHPEPKPITSGRSESSSIDVPEDKLTSSLDGDSGSVLSMSISSASETLAIKTVIELSRTDSEKMDASGTSDLFTISATSQEISLSSESKEEVETCPPVVPKTVESGTSTPTHQRDSSVTAVTLTTSTVDENGIQCCSTQVTSELSNELPKRSHRRNGSSSNFSSFIPQKPATDYVVGRLHESTESDKYRHDVPLSLKEEQDTEKKDIDERLEESYQTEADQALHREAREQKFGYLDSETELEQLDGSRPQSQVSKSDSESGNRAVSSGLSDDRPDSELAEVLIRGSSDGTFDEDIIERPLTPEPVDEIEIKDDTPEFSSEALASVTELELEYSHAFSRTVEYASHVSPIKEKPCVAWEHTGEHEEEMAEAEAAFHMVPHHSPHHTQHHHALPETILEDEDAEKHEFETREAALKEQQRRREEHARSISPAAIPDITVTQHLAPLIDRNFKYPDLDLEEQEAIAATSLSSRDSTSVSETTTDTSQGKEYILDDSTVTQSDISSVVDKTSVESKYKKTELDSMTESPTSESFEMLEKPEDMSDKMDISEEFVIVEEVGKEAHETDCEGQGVRIVSGSISIRKRDIVEDDDDFIATSPPPPATRMMDVKFYGEGGMLEEEDDQFHFDGGHVRVDTLAYEDTPADQYEAEAEVEAGKKWIEMQFKGEEPASVTTAYNYEMDFERGPLEDIKEEDEMATSSKIGSLGSQKESVGSFGSVKESLSSTPEYDVLAGRKYFTRSGDNDDISMSSLQEFESLEQQVALDATHKKMISSQDSLNGTSKKRVPGDDISLASLQEFEKMERACFEAERIEMKARVEEALLSEIDEGHESQVSESDETISGPGIKTIGDSDSEDYDKRMFEIDEIIRQAQSNVERFETPVRGSKSGGPESFGRGDSIEEVARVPDLEFDIPSSMVASTDSLELRSRHADSMVTSADSLEVKVSPGNTMVTSADSIELQQQLRTPAKGDIMTDSIELPTDPSHMVTSSDSLELETTLERVAGDIGEEDDASLAGRGSIRSGTSSVQERSSSSGREADLSFSSGRGACGGVKMDPAMLGSTDSLEPSSSTATHATYQYETDSIMSSSFTSGGSNTMVSSTETLEATSLQTEGVWYEEPYSEAGPYGTESIETSEDPEFSHILKKTVQSAPSVRKVTFRGPGAEAALKDYIEKFGPGNEFVETQEVDPDGNVHIHRVVQQRVVVQGDGLARSNLTRPELDEYLLQHGMTETDLNDLLTSTCSSSQPGVPGSGAVVATTQQRLTTSHLTGCTVDEELTLCAYAGSGGAAPAPTAAPRPAPRRPPPSHDISVDDEPEYDVREHDWRFNLQHSAEEAPEEEKE